MDEIWLPISGFESEYMVSNIGRVKSLCRTVRKWDGVRTVREKILRGSLWAGYPRVCFCVNGVQTYHSVHRIVAEAFIPNPHDLPEVNHKDESRDNNRVDNLEWCNRRYNVNYGTCPERIGKHSGASRVGLQRKRGKDSRKCVPVICVTTGERFYSRMEAADRYGINEKNITTCCKNRARNPSGGGRRTCGGMEWSYSD
jgi:hypothetical protein